MYQAQTRRTPLLSNRQNNQLVAPRVEPTNPTYFLNLGLDMADAINRSPAATERERVQAYQRTQDAALFIGCCLAATFLILALKK